MTMTLGSTTPKSLSLSEEILPSRRQEKAKLEKVKRPSVKPQTPKAKPRTLMSELFPVRKNPRDPHLLSIRAQRFKRKSESKLQTGTPKKKREGKSED